MATVYVVTAGSGDTYRIERVYLDSDQAYRFEEEYNGTGPVEPVQVEEWEAGGLRRPVLAGAVVGTCPGEQAPCCAAAYP